MTEGSNTTGGGTTTRYAYQVDAGGSVIGITDENGDEVARYAYDPYGVPTATSGTDPMAARNPLRYRGYYYDTETGMYYLPARYYEPRSARFLSVDPAPPKAGDPTTLNAYSYCFGDPVNRWDPTGADSPKDGPYDAPEWYNSAFTAAVDAGLPPDVAVGIGEAAALIAKAIPKMMPTAPPGFADLIGLYVHTALYHPYLWEMGDGLIDTGGTVIFIPTRIPGVGLGVTWGELDNGDTGWPVDRMRYLGLAIGKLGSVSGSVMGSTEWAERGQRYIEVSGALPTGSAGAVGFRSSIKDSDKPDSVREWLGINDTYSEVGVGSPGYPQLTWFGVY